MAERQFGPYRLVRQVAVGGMAEIHLAKAKGIAGFEKYVALKMIHPNFAEDEQFIQMLIDEAKIAVQLSHVNIGQTFDLGRVGDTYYITMEFVDGADLFKVLRQASELDLETPFDVAAFIGKEMLTGLDYAHRKRDASGRSLGIVHRDVSPQNVLVSNAGEIKLVDFGIAKATMKAKQTAAGVIKGKYYYMSPEQAWGDPVDHRSDIFSAGIVLYEMIVGQMLYLEEDLHRLLDMVRRADITPPSRLRPGCPPELERIVMHALARVPGERYQSAADMANDLERLLHTLAPAAGAGRVARWLRQVMGDPHAAPAAPAPTEGPAIVTIPIDERDLMQDRADLRDENSVIFRLDSLQPSAPSSPGAAPARPGRPRAVSDGDAGPTANMLPRGARREPDHDDVETFAQAAPGERVTRDLDLDPALPAGPPSRVPPVGGRGAGASSIRSTGGQPIIGPGTPAVRATGAVPVIGPGPAPATTRISGAAADPTGPAPAPLGRPPTVGPGVSSVRATGGQPTIGPGTPSARSGPGVPAMVPSVTRPVPSAPGPAETGTHTLEPGDLAEVAEEGSEQIAPPPGPGQARGPSPAAGAAVEAIETSEISDIGDHTMVSEPPRFVVSSTLAQGPARFAPGFTDSIDAEATAIERAWPRPPSRDEEEAETLTRQPPPTREPVGAAGAAPALAARNPTPAVSELRRPRSSRRTPTEGVPATGPSVLGAIVGAMGAEPMPTGPHDSGRSRTGSVAPPLPPMPSGPNPAAPLASVPSPGPATLHGHPVGAPVPPPLQPGFPSYGAAVGAPPPPGHGVGVGVVGVGVGPGPMPPGLPPGHYQPPQAGWPGGPGAPPPGGPYPQLAQVDQRAVGAAVVLPGYGGGYQSQPTFTRQMQASLDVDEIPPQYRIQHRRPPWLLPVLGIAIAASLAAGLTYTLMRGEAGRPAAATLLIDSVPSGATVTVDGQVVANKTPLPFAAGPPGTSHDVRVELPRHRPYQQTVVIPAGGGEVRVTAVLPSLPGAIQIDSIPTGADIYIKGELRGRTATRLSDLDIESTRELELRHRDHGSRVVPLSWPDDGQLTLT
ncbi:MAG: protein kinase, partial [Kofleriaceae bacterium]|nr:protein kinase [Kofleriaceae bacterium]